MYNIKLLNKIAKVGTDIFGDNYKVGEDVANPDAIMVRSASMHDTEFGPELLAIARAGAGVNNIPIDRCAENGIVVFNTPGANANGVKELAVASLLLASRNITGGIEWVKTLAGTEGISAAIEKGKSKFAGCEIRGKRLGVIGLGAIGGLVANAAASMGMEVVGCDPYITIDAAWSLSRAVKHAASYDEIFASCDYISVHVPATEQTKNMFRAENFAKMKDGVRIINLSRADLVNSADMIEAVKSGKVAAYVTDFATDDIIGVDNIIVMPHLGASTSESEDNCAVMAANELVDYIENGNIKNSVNFPSVTMQRGGDERICVLHRNKSGLLSSVSSAVADEGINIENMLNKSKGDYAYTIMDVTGKVPDSLIEKLKNSEDVLGVRRIG